MTPGKWERTAAPIPSHAPDVLAGMVDDSSAVAVARAAAREAVSRRVRLRVLQAVPSSASPAKVAAATEATFAVVLGALRGVPQIPVKFEIVDGDTAQEFVERSDGAGLLVVGVDEHDGLAAYCLRHARCDVLTVRAPRAVTPS